MITVMVVLGIAVIAIQFLVIQAHFENAKLAKDIFKLKDTIIVELKEIIEHQNELIATLEERIDVLK